MILNDVSVPSRLFENRGRALGIQFVFVYLTPHSRLDSKESAENSSTQDLTSIPSQAGGGPGDHSGGGLGGRLQTLPEPPGYAPMRGRGSHNNNNNNNTRPDGVRRLSQLGYYNILYYIILIYTNSRISTRHISCKLMPSFH